MNKPVKCIACDKIDEKHTLYDATLPDDQRFQRLITSNGENPTFCFECYDELLECAARLYQLFDEDTEHMMKLISRSDILQCLKNKMCL
ncbi:MAG: hypothetical protein RR448_08380 [Niameybacter sp.]|uniref:hypothetical protein n=1 Tax=Niameybacter sp. TaxID=2033640 RepID=UPI002FCC1E7C